MVRPQKRVGWGLVAVSAAVLAAVGIGSPCEGLIEPSDERDAARVDDGDSSADTSAQIRDSGRAEASPFSLSSCSPAALRPSSDPNAALCSPLAAGFGDFAPLYANFYTPPTFRTDGRDAYFVDTANQIIRVPGDGGPLTVFGPIGTLTFSNDDSGADGSVLTPTGGLGSLVGMDDRFLYLQSGYLLPDAGCCTPDGSTGMTALIAWPTSNKDQLRATPLKTLLGPVVPCGTSGNDVLGSQMAYGPPSTKFVVNDFDPEHSTPPGVVASAPPPAALDGAALQWEFFDADDTYVYASAMGLYDAPLGRIARGGKVMDTFSPGARAFGPSNVILSGAYLYFVREANVFTSSQKTFFSRIRKDFSGSMEDLEQPLDLSAASPWAVDSTNLYYAAANKVRRVPLDYSAPSDLPINARGLAVSHECLWWLNDQGVFRAPKGK